MSDFARELDAIRRGVGGAVERSADNFADDMTAARARSAAAVAKPDQAEAPGMLTSIGAGLGQGMGMTALGLQQLAGRGAQAVGMDRVGGWLQQDADEGVRRLKAENAPYAAAHPIANTAGDIAGNVVGGSALPLGKLKDGAGWVAKGWQGFKAGAAGGAAQAVDPDSGDAFWSEKAKQTGIGAGAGVVGVPVAGMIGGVLSKAWGSGKQTFESLMGRARQLDPAVAEAVANSPTLRQLVEQATREGRSIDATTLARHARADSLPIPVRLTRGMATGDLTHVSDERNMRGVGQARLAYMINDANESLKANVAHVRASAAPDAVSDNPYTAGAQVIESIRGLQKARRGEIQAAYKELADANGGHLPLNGEEFANAAGAKLRSDFEFLPAVFQKKLEAFSATKSPMDFDTFETLRTQLARAQRSAKDGNERHALGVMRDTLENMPMTGAAGEVKALADKARGLAKAEFERSRASDAYKEIANGAATKDTFIRDHVINQKDSDQFARLAADLKHDPQAMQTVRAGVIDYLMEKAAAAGTLNQSTYNSTINKTLGRKLDILFDPKDASVLREVGKVAADVQRLPSGHWVNSSNTETSRLRHQVEQGTLAAAEHVTNMATKSPAGSFARSWLTDRAEKKAGEAMERATTGPAAGSFGESEVRAAAQTAKSAAIKPTAITMGQFIEQTRERKKP